MRELPAGLLSLRVLERVRSLPQAIEVYAQAVAEARSADGARESGG
ncbi:hypothetical protein [Aulosira sp. FACHB-615]|nr:hypothetical protein [Aulosira sp. FACHB-615]MBD2492090.1 hypothetical protein [Aulosira sp. FACHB-615]